MVGHGEERACDVDGWRRGVGEIKHERVGLLIEWCFKERAVEDRKSVV
jgi:hypothetical protein